MSFSNSEECYTLKRRARYASESDREEALSECDKMQQEEYEAENPTPEDDSELEDENEDLEEEVLEDEEEEEKEEKEEKKEEKLVEVENGVQQAGFGGMGINTVLIISVIGLLLIYAYKTK